VVARYRFAMRALFILLVSLGVVAAVQAADTVNGRVLKVLPFLLDQQGRNAKSPSLFDRDAYQAYLLQHPTNVTAMRFDVLWKAAKSPEEQTKITIELRGSGTNSVPTINTLETNVAPGKYRQWTTIPLAGDNYKNVGSLVAWRVRLWNNGQMLDEQKSFLW
jgi:hypothetical protein